MVRQLLELKKREIVADAQQVRLLSPPPDPALYSMLGSCSYSLWLATAIGGATGQDSIQLHCTGGRPSFEVRNCPVSGNRGLAQNLALGTSLLLQGGPKRGMMLSPALHVARGGSPLRWGTSVS
jgi:hypothetical protein